MKINSVNLWASAPHSHTTCRQLRSQLCVSLVEKWVCVCVCGINPSVDPNTFHLKHFPGQPLDAPLAGMLKKKVPTYPELKTLKCWHTCTEQQIHLYLHQLRLRMQMWPTNTNTDTLNGVSHLGSWMRIPLAFYAPCHLPERDKQTTNKHKL